MSYDVDEGVQDAQTHLETLQALRRDHPGAYRTTFLGLDVWMSPDLGRPQATDVYWPNEPVGLYVSTDEYTVWPQDMRPVYLSLVMHEMRRREPELYRQVVQFVKQFG